MTSAQPHRTRGDRIHSALKRGLQILGIGIVATGVILSRAPRPLAANTADPTFAEDVAPILYRNCTGCHRPGSIGPMPLFEYDTAKAYTTEMREKVSAGDMPPWHATGPRGVFRNDRRLSEADKNTIIRWIDAGAKSGDLKKLPPRPVYPVSWSIGNPDVALSMPKDFTVPATGVIDYQDFEVPTNFKEDKWIQAYEIMPGSREVVHHVQVYARMPPAPPRPAGSPEFLPAWTRNRTFEPPVQPPPKTFLSRFRAQPLPKGTLIASMAPGTNAIEFPQGSAMLLRAGTVLTFTMHYTAHGKHAMKDRTTIGFRFAKERPAEEIHASQFTNETFVIPPGAKVQVPAEITARQPIRVWGLLPHTHLRGTGWQYKVVRPDGTSEIILDVPKYNFNWQTYYLFAKPLELTAGSKITSAAWFDNTASNKNNPDPSKTVKDGPQTWDEMQYTGLLFSVPAWDPVKNARR